MVNSSEAKRNSSIELLRIICIIMIIFHHFSIHGAFTWSNTSLTIPHFWCNFIIYGGKVGTNIFVLISGYFLINDNKVFNFKRIFKFLFQVFFYSIVLYFIFLIFGYTEFSLKYLIKSLLPITYSMWWFASTYFVLYVLHPFLNKLLNNLDKGLYQKLIILLILFWSIIPTFLMAEFQVNDLLWFVNLYAIGGYINKYDLNPKFKAKHYLISSIILYLIVFGLSSCFIVLGKDYQIFYHNIYYFSSMFKLPILLISLCLFMYFVKTNIKYNKLINTISSTTFGIYLIHEHYLMRPFLWEHLFKNASYKDTIFIIPYSIIVVLIIYVIFVIVDLLRIKFIENNFMKFINKYINKINILLSYIVNKLNLFIFGS